jgi:hypothetical protein
MRLKARDRRRKQIKLDTLFNLIERRFARLGESDSEPIQRLGLLLCQALLFSFSRDIASAIAAISNMIAEPVAKATPTALV